MYDLPAKAPLCFAIITWGKCYPLCFIGFNRPCLGTVLINTGVHICQSTREITVHACVRSKECVCVCVCVCVCERERDKEQLVHA